MSTVLSAVFPVVTYKRGNQSFKSHGTAFFINGEGVFVTAAHTFRNPTREHLVIIDGKPMPFIIIHREYLDHEDQLPPEYKDLLIGKVEGIHSPNFYSLSPSDTLKEGAKLIAPGFALLDEQPAPVVQSFSTMDDLMDDLLEDSEEEPALNADPKLNRLRLIDIPAIFVQPGFQHIDKVSELKDSFVNGFTFNTDVSDPHGHSGCPLIGDANAYGMLVGDKGAISAEYILEKLQNPDSGMVQSNLQMPVPATEGNQWIREVVAVVHGEILKNDQLYQQHHGDIYYLSATDAAQLDNPVSPFILKGIGGVQSNYILDGRPVHLVVINPDICEEANFTTAEIQAATVHELGHIFNMHEHQVVPNVLDAITHGTSYDPDEAARIKLENRTNDEIYADAYARRNGWTAPLKRGLIKYRGLKNAENIEMIDQRLEKFDTNENFKGDLKTLRQA
jgi:hypothetical protein